MLVSLMAPRMAFHLECHSRCQQPREWSGSGKNVHILHLSHLQLRAHPNRLPFTQAVHFIGRGFEVPVISGVGAVGVFTHTPSSLRPLVHRLMFQIDFDSRFQQPREWGGRGVWVVAVIENRVFNYLS